MARKDHMDAIGAAALVLFSAVYGFNQVVIKVVNAGFQPVFFACLRSIGAVFCIWAWMRFRGYPITVTRDTILPGIAVGALFAVQFIFLFVALDMTTVTRSSVLYYSMPLWLTLAAHFMLAGDQISLRKVAGLIAAFGGVAWALFDRASPGGQANLLGDIFALAAAICWAVMIIILRVSRLNRVRPEMQLMWEVAISVPILMVAAPFFGPFIRDLQPVHLAGLAFQIVVISSAGFIFWLWLLTIYPASGVASFSFLSPLFGVMFGWLLLDEHLGRAVIGPLVLVAVGLVLINLPGRRPVQVPQ